MSLISHRACYIGARNEDLDKIVQELKTFLAEAGIPETYSVNVYKDQVTCCGHFPFGIAIEIQGPKEQPIKSLDEKIVGKIKEICGREHVKDHECTPIEILQNIKGSVFIQG